MQPLKRFVLALSALILAAIATPAPAQTMIDGGNIDTVLAVARTYGSAILESQSNGDPKLSGQIDRIRYAIYFLGCTEHRDCRHLNFYAGFADAKPPLESINEWNREKRFGRAYLDSVGDAVVEMDVNMSHGVARDNLDSSFALWRVVLGQFIEHVSFE